MSTAQPPASVLEAMIYDMVYLPKRDFAASAAYAVTLAERHLRSQPEQPRLLEVGCRTGLHLAAFPSSWTVEGSETEEAYRAIARSRLPQVTIHPDEPHNLALGAHYDAIVCLFGMISRLHTMEQLNAGLNNLVTMLRPGGVLLIEPWHRPNMMKPRPQGDFTSSSGLGVAVARMSQLVGKEPEVDLTHHCHLGRTTRSGGETVTPFSYTHRLRVHSPAELRSAMQAAGLSDIWDDPGAPHGKGMLIGVRC
ncbi:MAG TPA: class I SAM-dependent methyltransferase [Candidatus Saccharimonadia bacterium]|nr:class I SAM-dependent methyltransferase [Candidatus Saccharimonadia bacterium]